MASEIKRRFTDAEMQIAKETDLPELLTHLGYQVRRIGRYHTTADQGPPQVVSVLAEYWRGRHYLPAAILRQELFGGCGVPTGLSRQGQRLPYQSGAFCQAG